MTNTMRRVRGYQAASIRRQPLVKFQYSAVKPLISGAKRAKDRKKEAK